MKHFPAKSDRRRFSEWLAVRLDVPADMTDDLRLHLRGRHTLTVHGCTRILDFSPALIRLALADGTLTVAGERLICTSYLAGAVGIEGTITALSFGEECDPA